MDNKDLISQLLNIPTEGEYEIKLESGFLNGLVIDVNYKDRLAMEAINYILSKKENATYQDILDIANDIIVWIGWFAIMKKNMIRCCAVFNLILRTRKRS